MKKYKLIAVTEMGDKLTKEYEHIVTNLKDAETEAEKLRLSLKDEYPDCRVECLEFNEYVASPSQDFRVWIYSTYDHKAFWMWMKVSSFGIRLYTYIK